MRKIKPLFSKLSTSVLLIVIAILLVGRLIGQTSYFGYQLRVVMSGSMEPAVKRGSLVLIKETKGEPIAVGDIVTVKLAEDYVTHRVVAIEKTQKLTAYETKGDTNSQSDKQLITADDVVGKVIASIPYVGMLFLLFRTPHGVVATVLILMSIFLLGYFLKELFGNHQVRLSRVDD